MERPASPIYSHIFIYSCTSCDIYIRTPAKRLPFYSYCCMSGLHRTTFYTYLFLRRLSGRSGSLRTVGGAQQRVGSSPCLDGALGGRRLTIYTQGRFLGLRSGCDQDGMKSGLPVCVPSKRDLSKLGLKKQNHDPFSRGFLAS